MNTTTCIFHDTDASAHDQRIFEIVEEAYRRRENATVFAASEERAAEIDRCLWILHQDSFIPHRLLAGGDATGTVPVAIITGEWRPFASGVLVADGHCSIAFARGFERIHEFVYHTPPGIKEECRKRFRAYRDESIPVQYLKAKSWTGDGSK